MARFDEFERSSWWRFASWLCGFNFRNHAVELLMKHCLRVYEVKFGDQVGGHFNGRQLLAQFFGQTKKYFEDFAQLCFAEGLQFVVSVNCLERFDESCRTG